MVEMKVPKRNPTDEDDYKNLSRILTMAFKQSAEGKGKDRHANGLPWDDQPIITIGTEDRGFCTGQARKKCLEAKNLPPDRAIFEILGAINYLAAEVRILEMLGE